MPYLPSRTIPSAIFSAVIRVGKLVLAHGHQREDRGVDDAQALDAAHAALRVGDGHGVAVGAHAAAAGGVPHADRRLAHERLARLVVGHHLLEGEALGDDVADQVAPERGRPVEQRAGDRGQELVLGVDDADLAHAVGVAGRERVDVTALHGRRRRRACRCMRKASISRSRSRRSDSRLNSTSGSARQSREVSLTWPRSEARVVDGDQERGDALADRVPGRLADGDDEHVALVHAGQVCEE